MKKFLHIALLIGAVSALMCSCEPEPKADGVAEIKSFAITAAANEALSQDCAAIIDQTAATIVVALPMDTDKSALVPTFTTTDGDVVTVAGAEVKSGQSALDLTEGVEVVVTDASSNVTKTYALSAADNDGKAELLSVGFLAKDNTGKLTEDAVAEAIADEMVVRIAGGGAGVELVMSFTAGLNDVVTVNNEEAVATATVDCTFPIDITVSDPYAGVEKKYVVKVGKILQNAGWKRVATIADPLITAKDFSMDIDPVTEDVYVAYSMNFYDAATDKTTARATVSKWNGEALSLVGPACFSSGKATYYNIIVNNGQPYVMYVDGNVSSALTVQTYTGGAWSVLGQEGAILKNTGMAKDRSAMVFSGNKLMTFTTANADDATTGIKKRGSNLSVWDGSAWTSSPLPNRDAAWYAYTPRAVSVGDDVYVIYANQLSSMDATLTNGVSIYKYSNGAWSLIVDNFLPEGNSTVALYYQAIKANSKGEVYLLLGDDSSSKWYIQMFKLKGNTLEKVYPAIQNVLNSDGQYDFVFDNNDLPVVAYRNADEPENVKVVTLDADSETWNEATTISEETTEGNWPIFLKRSESGNLYLSYVTLKYAEDGKTKLYEIPIYQNALEADVLPE